MSIFNKDRIAFVVFGDQILPQPTADDIRPCHEWMASDLHLRPVDYENAIRGYILPGRIHFFTGGAACTPAYNLPKEAVQDALDVYRVTYRDAPDPVIGNGCIVGEEGAQWAPVLIWENGRWALPKEEM